MHRSVPFLMLLACAHEGPAIEPPDAGDVVDLGRLGAGRLTAFAVRLRAGSEPLVVTRATIHGDGFGTVGDAWVRGLAVEAAGADDVVDGAHTVPAGSVFDWPFVVLPSALGPLEGDVRFELAGGASLEVRVTADAVVPEVRVGPAEVSFGAVPAGELETRELFVENLDDVVLVLDATFADPDVFSTFEPQPFVLHGGRSSRFEIAAKPNSDAGIRSEVVLSVVGVEVGRVALIVEPAGN